MKLIREKTPKHAVSLLWSTRTISLSFCWAVVAQVTYFCTDHLGLNAAIVGLLLLVSKIVDCISNFVIANIVDNGNHKLGKARPHEIHIVLLWICVVLMFSIPSSWGSTAKYILILLLYILNAAVHQTFLSCTDTIYLRRAFSDDNQRAVIQAVAGALSMISMFGGIALMPLLIAYFENIPGGWTIMTLIIAIPMAIIGSIRFFLFPEVETNVEVKPEDRSSMKDTLSAFIGNKYVILITLVYFVVQLQSNLQSTPGTYYFTYIVGDLRLSSLVTTIGYIAVAALFFCVPLGKKFGRVNVLRASGIICVIGCIIRIFAGSNIALLSTSAVLTGIVNYVWMAFGPLMLIEVMEYGEWKNGKLTEGAIFAATGLGTTLGAGIGGSISGIILGLFGYDGTLEVQSASALFGIRLCYAVIPAVLLAIGTLLFFFYDLEKKMPKIRADLKERHEAAVAAVGSEEQ